MGLRCRRGRGREIRGCSWRGRGMADGEEMEEKVYGEGGYSCSKREVAAVAP